MHVFTLYTSTSRNKPSSLAFGTNKAKKKWIISSMAQSFATCQARKRAGEPGLLLWILGEEGPGHWNCWVQMKIMKQWFKHQTFVERQNLRAIHTIGNQASACRVAGARVEGQLSESWSCSAAHGVGLWMYRRVYAFKDVGPKMKKFNLHFQHFSSFCSD